MTVKEAAALWGVSERRVHAYLEADRVPGAYRDMKTRNGDWVIPDGAKKPSLGKPGRKPLK